MNEALSRFLRNAPIRQKLLVTIVASITVALMVAGTGIVIMDSFIFRRTMRNDLATLARIIGDNSTAALIFDDPRVAGDILSALKARPHMVAACLYRADDAPFARYVRAGSTFACPSPVPGESIQTTRDGMAAFHPVVMQGRRLGTLFLLYDLNEIPARIRLYGGVVLAILLLASALAVVLSSRLRALIASPIARLATAAHSVSESGDYGIRVTKEGNDELGVLVEAFNGMLARIQTRDQEVQNARNSLETTLKSIADAVISTDSAGRIVFANAVAATLLQFPEGELAGRAVDDVFRIRNAPSPVARVMREGGIVTLPENSFLISRNGRELPIHGSAAPIRPEGRIIGVVLVFRDISEILRAQQDAAYLAAIVDSTDDAIIGKSTDGIIQSWNPGAEHVYGYSAHEVIGRPMAELLPEDRRHEESDILERMRHADRMIHLETVRVRKDGRRIDVALTISPIRDKTGHVVGLSHVARDITEQKRAAEQLRHTQKLESLGVLAGGIAHDFNNLLTGILGNASLALEDIHPASPVRSAIEAVIGASERAAQLAQQMLAYSGKGRFVVERLNLSETVRATLQMIRAAVPGGVGLHLNLADDLPEIEADPGQIQQVVMNIIINGAEAIPDGGPGSVTITTRAEELPAGNSAELEPGPYVLFEVADTGCGMDHETKSRIFDPFFTTKFTGRGLGLAAVLGIVRGHRGSISVSSTPGEGSTFRVLLPAVRQTVGAKRDDEPLPTSARSRDGGLVLVVDDEQLVRNLARQALERYGYTALLAEDGARGLDLFRHCAGRLGCVVLDLTMPVLSGEETLAQMKRFNPEVPVILSSGFDEVQAIRRFEGKGIAGFLQKPYTAAALVAKIQTVLVQQRMATGMDAGTA